METKCTTTAASSYWCYILPSSLALVLLSIVNQSVSSVYMDLDFVKETSARTTISNKKQRKQRNNFTINAPSLWSRVVKGKALIQKSYLFMRYNCSCHMRSSAVAFAILSTGLSVKIARQNRRCDIGLRFTGRRAVDSFIEWTRSIPVGLLNAYAIRMPFLPHAAMVLGLHSVGGRRESAWAILRG